MGVCGRPRGMRVRGDATLPAADRPALLLVVHSLLRRSRLVWRGHTGAGRTAARHAPSRARQDAAHCGSPVTLNQPPHVPGCRVNNGPVSFTNRASSPLTLSIWMKETER